MRKFILRRVIFAAAMIALAAIIIPYLFYVTAMAAGKLPIDPAWSQIPVTAAAGDSLPSALWRGMMTFFLTGF